MSESSAHPSFLELDRQCLGLSVDASTAAHVAACARCGQYIASYRPATDAPAWLSAKATRSASERPKRTPHASRARLVWAGSFALVAAVCLAVYWPARREGAYDGVKGGPSVALFVQRAGLVGLWDGAPLRAGDRIRLQVMPDEFDFVSVFGLPVGGAAPQRLYTGPLTPRASALLPKAWQLDAAPGPEQLVVLLSHAELSDQAVKALLRARDPREVWLVQLKLPKQGGSR
jgi:hypothetical protein